MEKLVSEHVYTHAGWQRPVFMQPGVTRVRFEAAEGMAIETSYDPPGSLKRGQGQWLPHEGGGCGCEQGITALRARVTAPPDGWVTLRVEQERDA